MPRWFRHRPLRPVARRRGVLTLELVLVLPILLIVILAIVQLAALLMASQALQAAASVGAREASLPGATHERVVGAVQRTLEPWRFAPHLDPVRIEPVDPSAAASGDPVTVSVSVDSALAAPNLLNVFGVRLAGQKLAATFVYRKE